MFQHIHLATLASLLGLTTALSAGAQSLQPDAKTLQETRAMAGELLTQLSGKLQASMKADGPAASIGVCKLAAPDVARQLSGRTGWDINRVGTRVRNADMGTPNAWQHKALANLSIDLKDGADAKNLEWAEVVQEGGKPVLHYAKAIALQAQCVACHGGASEIPAAVAEKIKASYPLDEATGYAVGDLRGAVVISRPLN